MNASSIAAELQQLEQYEFYDTIVRQLGVSAVVLYTWDFVLTFQDEVNILWGTRWTTSRILFFINRYFGLATIIASTFFDVQTNPDVTMYVPRVDIFLPAYLFTNNPYFLGHAFTNFDIIGCLLVANIEIILLRRLFALYDYKRVIVIPMVALFIIYICSMMGIAIAMSIYAQENEYVLMGVCEEAIPSWFIPFWTPIMAFDFVIMALAGFKSVQHYRRVPNKNWSGARFMKTLARDSFIYFACNFFNYLAITFVFHLAPPEFLQLGASWTIVIPPITANHLLINMEQSRFRTNDTTTQSNTSVESESSEEIELAHRRVPSTPLIAIA
ncbi:hypothetical protein DEU56DRAFT_944702 [Suillus clintonianus]|uniref:uncharacterized protein n=1 Tax=Suillus clintonianus TaxID=1904413 RepID=UPI001B8746B9|nr:uncharacterized protein DEU56DRAFT_944702 [Suillus clintonianus]KAG2139063.1 hypothetical protein DEU56DRAFT_944702 [Suillus clintonianus]